MSGGLARASVFGMSDGLISNVSLVIGFAGSGVDGAVVRLAGLAGAIAGAVSMAAGEWISISAQNEITQREIAVERTELEVNARAEQAELATMYQAHGMEPETARRAAAEVMRSAEQALAVHSREELGVDPDDLPSAAWAAILSLLCFAVGALLPVIPWLAGGDGNGPTIASVAIGVVGAAGLGAAIGAYGNRSLRFTVARQVAILLGACVVTYALGSALDVGIS